MATPEKRTKGEELYLVHLHRQEGQDADPDAEDDHDYPEQRKRSRSIGEELYQVHLKRSHGLVESDGVEEKAEVAKADSDKQDDHQMGGISPMEGVTKTTQKSPKKASGHELHLRNRDVPPVSSQ